MKKITLILTFLALTCIQSAGAQQLLTIDGTLSNTNGQVINVFIGINLNSTTPTVLYTSTDTNGYYWDTLSVSSSAGSVVVTFIDCHSDTISGKEIYVPSRLNVTMNFDYCPVIPSCMAYFAKNQAYDSLRNPIPGMVQIKDLSIGNNLSYYWTFGDGSSSTSKNPVHTYSGNGPYVLCLGITDGINCSDSYCDTVTVDTNGNVKSLGFTIFVGETVPVWTGLQKREINESTVFVYPNPVRNGTISVKFTSLLKDEVDIMVINSLGKQIITKSIVTNVGENTVLLDVENLLDGIYFILVNDGENRMTSKFFKGGN